MRSKKIMMIVAIGISLNLAGLALYLKTGREQAVLAYNQDNLIRFHVLANSDSLADQALKRKVRDRIVREMAPRFSTARDLSEAREIAKANLETMEAIAQWVIREEGKRYPVMAQLGTFPFPTKSYGRLTLPAGEYEAVRVVIGEGAGANWWCVLFPPLCFVSLSESLATDSPEALPATTGKDDRPRVEIKFKIVEALEKVFQQK